MENKSQIILLFTSILLTFLITGCNQDSQPQQTADAGDQNAKLYDNNGLSVAYPSHWKNAYDDTPAIYAERAVGFQVSDFSTASVLVKPAPPGKEAFADRLENELQLATSEYVKDYMRVPVDLAGFSGEKLSWLDTMVGTSRFEVYVIEITAKPVSIFAVFNLSDEDINKEAQNIQPFIKSIRYNK